MFGLSFLCFFHPCTAVRCDFLITVYIMKKEKRSSRMRSLLYFNDSADKIRKYKLADIFLISKCIAGFLGTHAFLDHALLCQTYKGGKHFV